MDFVILVLALIVFIVNYFFTGWFLGYAEKNRITDIPTERSSHTIPTPRGGGAGFVLASISAIAVFIFISDNLPVTEFIVFMLACLFISSLGWFDDKYNLSRGLRFVAQIVASLSVLYFIHNLDRIFFPVFFEFQLGYMAFVIGCLWLTGATNIYNFMDGTDGIASVQAIGAGLGWVVIALIFGEPVILALNIFLIFAVFAFLIFNWAPAKIFMGDAGSLYLGFFFACMPLLAASISDDLNIEITIWVGALLLWPFLFDGSFTIFRRALRNENIFQAHRSHLYQRLNIAGWSHTRISLLYLFFSLCSAFLAVVFTLTTDLFKLIIIFSLTILSFAFSYYVITVEETYTDKLQ